MRAKSTHVVLYIYRVRKFSPFRDLVLSTDAGLGIVYFCTKSAKIITSNISRAACFILGRQKSNAPVSGVFKGREIKGDGPPNSRDKKFIWLTLIYSYCTLFLKRCLFINAAYRPNSITGRGRSYIRCISPPQVLFKTWLYSLPYNNWAYHESI